MGRKRNDQAELTRCVSVARDVVDEALPLDSLTGERKDRDRAELRKIAFGMILRELLDYES